METRRMILQMLRQSHESASNNTILVLEHRLTSMYGQDPTVYQRNTQIVANQLRAHGDDIITNGVLDTIDATPGSLSMKILLKNRDQAAKELYHQSITDFEELVGVNGSMLQCRKCKQHTVIWAQQQTRSGDEGATTFCKCLNPKCQAKWIA